MGSPLHDDRLLMLLFSARAERRVLQSLYGNHAVPGQSRNADVHHTLCHTKPGLEAGACAAFLKAAILKPLYGEH